MTLSSLSAELPAWRRDLEAQVRERNAVETGPSATLFSSYASLYARALLLQKAEGERRRLQDENTALIERVRQLEAAAASSQLRTAREEELQRRKDELQERLQEYLVKDSEYYKGVAEVQEWRVRVQVAESRAATLEGELARQSSELQLIKKEYLAQRDGLELAQSKANESDRHLLGLKESRMKLVHMQERVVALEAEVERLRQLLQASSTAKHSDPMVQQQASAPTGTMREDSPQICLTSSRTDVVEGQVYPSAAARVLTDPHGGAILQSICIAENNRLLFTAGSDKMIRVWDVNTGMSARHFSSGNFALSLYSTSHFLLGGCADRVARLWDTNTLRSIELAGHTDKVVSACLSSSAQHAFTASADSTIRLWDVRARSALRTLMCTSTANDVMVAGGQIFSAHFNGTVVVWDRRTATRVCEVMAHQRSATCVRVSNDGRLCVSVGRDNAISVRDSRMMSTPLRCIMTPDIVVSNNMTRFALSPDSKVCALGNPRGEVMLVALEEETERAHGGNTIVATLSNNGHARDSYVFATSWGVGPRDPLVSMGEDRRVVLWQ